jgi:hypothetical protein
MSFLARRTVTMRDTLTPACALPIPVDRSFKHQAAGLYRCAGSALAHHQHTGQRTGEKNSTFALEARTASRNCAQRCSVFAAASIAS